VTTDTLLWIQSRRTSLYPLLTLFSFFISLYRSYSSFFWHLPCLWYYGRILLPNMKGTMKQFLVALGVIVLLVGVIIVSGVAAGTSEVDADCPCLDPCQNRAEELELLREHPELLLEQSESVQPIEL